MSEPNLTAAGVGSSAAIVSLATLALGPILGESIIIISLGLLGTLIALSEELQPTLVKSAIFVLKGVIFSFVFAGIVTSLAIEYLPKNLGITPYAILGVVSFMIGWTSNKWGGLRDWFVRMITSRSSSQNQSDGNKQ